MNRIMNKTKIFLLLLAVLWFASQEFHEGSSLSAGSLKEKEKPEVISLLGKKLYAAPAEGEELLKLQDELKEAIKKVEADPENPEHLIMYGRRLAYLWKYHEAIDVYTRGIKIHPDQAMLYRHRGHRYISIRKFDLAVKDLTKASELNDHDFDIWYHLGLAHYLKGEFEKALWAYQNCLRSARDHDSKIAISNWLYITLRRLGKKEEAAKALDGITEGMEVVENQSYHGLLFFYKGLKSEAEVEALAEVSDLDMATIGYGIGCWHLYNNNTGKAKIYFEKIMKGRYWPAFGFIAAEAELFQMRE
jgi:tetratricopeptide (TPR) repeat protein